MKIGKWKIEIQFLKPFTKKANIHFWVLKLYIFNISMTDLGGVLTICNCSIHWNKYFK